MDQNQDLETSKEPGSLKGMSPLSWSCVEEWLDSNPQSVEDYFLKKVELPLVNKWLSSHGFVTVMPPTSNLKPEKITSCPSTTSPATLTPDCRLVKLFL